MDTLIEATKTLGMPVVVAIALIWHFINSNKTLTEHNRELLSQLGQLRELMNTSINRIQDTERLLDHNEKLVEAVQKSERASFELVRQLLGSDKVAVGGEDSE